jgi:hypothetical protein
VEYLHADQDSDRDRQICHNAPLGQVSRGETDRDPGDRDLEAAVAHGDPDPFTGFPDLASQIAYHIKTGQAAGNIGFYPDQGAVDAQQGTGYYGTEHRKISVKDEKREQTENRLDKVRLL